MGYVRLLSVCFIAGSLALLTFNGITLWHSAFELNASKFPLWAAWSAVGMLAVECLGLAVAREIWHKRLWIMAGLTVLFTLACALYLFRLDMNTNVAGRADREAVRESSIEDRRADREELKSQKELRDRLQAKTKLSNDERRSLIDARRRITAIEARWHASIVVAAEKTPDAGWVSRWLSLDIQNVDDFMQAMPLLVGVLLRLLCMPIGLTLWSMANEPPAAAAPIQVKRPLTAKPATDDEDEEEGEPEGDGGAISPAHGGDRLGPNGKRITSRAVPKHLNESHGRRESIVYGDIPPSRIARPGGQALVHGSAAAFIADALVYDSARNEKGRPKHLLKASEAHDAYKIWCATRAGGGVTPLGAAQFGIAFKEVTGRPAVVRGTGAYYANWRLRTEVDKGEAGRSSRGEVSALAAVHH